ncbi:ABC transporter substrate-binding protein [Eggerthellaceae bacterium 24-137]
MKKFVLCAAAAALALALAGCGQQEADSPATANAPAQEQQTEAPETPAGDNAGAEAKAPGPVTFTDDMGNEVTVDNPQRVVACMGSFANAWELAGGTLVGVSDDALTAAGWTIASPDVATVGDFTAVNLEAIIALNPDFVIMTSGTGGRGGDSSQADLRDALVSSGIPVAYFQVTTFDDYERLMRIFTDITGREDLYEQNAVSVAEAIDGIVGAVPAENPPTALVLTTFSGGTRVQASATQTGAMLADLGVRNLADENRSLLKDFSLEAVIEMNPDFIFVIPMGDDAEAAMRNLEEATAANPAWSSLAAVQNGRYITLDPTLYLAKPNAKWAEAYQGLYDSLYGQN